MRRIAHVVDCFPMSAKRTIVRATIARLSIGLTLGLVLGVVLHQSNTSTLYSNVLQQGAFGAVGSDGVSASSVPDSCCAPGGTCVLASSDLCAPGASVYAGTTCGGLSGGLGQPCDIQVSSAFSSSCHGSGENCDDGAGCCEGYDCTSPDNQNFTCTALSSSFSSSVYCCAFDGTGCVAAPDGDAGNDLCDQNRTGYADDTCDNACGASSSAQQWCCQHVLPVGPANCSAL